MKHTTTSVDTVTPTSNSLIRAFRWTRMLLHIAQGLLVTILVYPRVKPAVRTALTQAWAKKMLRILNITLAVHGARPEANTPKSFVIANHVSWLDIFVINATTPSRFVAKSEIRDWPIAGVLCEAAGTIFVHRSKRSDTARINAEIHEALEQGDTVAIFPEGTTTTGDRLLKFHTSLFEPAVANQALLAPAAIRYRNTNGEPSEAALFIGETTFVQSISAIIAKKKMIADITFAPSIATDALSRRDAALLAENAIAAILDVAKPHAHQRFGEGATSLATQAA
jgi:1-acyl-sn-glycerol-3-phosphate acyltransferase